VNLLLLDAAELGEDSVFSLADRRARHLRDVLEVTVGSTVRTGIVGGDLGTATVTAVDGDSVTLRFATEKPAPLPLPIDLVLAIPRPKVITRTIEIAASFGVRRIDLTNAWRVDKSYLGSPRLAPDALAFAARFGAEQGATTHIPPIHIHDRFMAMLEARFSDAHQPPLRLVAHPGAPPLEQVVTDASPLALAIGPEGGWIERELETLDARGFKRVSLGDPILRVEAAVASALGQLSLLRRLRA
jgi:16S rRNA (uracil1498-N3)-methyltransferase